MSLFQDFIEVIASGLFGKSENPDIKIIPKIESEDVELGHASRKVIEMHKTEKYMDCEFKSIIQNPDLELGFGPIVEINCGDVIVDMNAFEKCNIYENYISFMESISYLATPLKERSYVFFRDMYPSWNKKLINNEFHIVMHIESESIGVRFK
jgi:hypothetical protein